MTHNALLAALLVRLAQRDAELAERDAELASLKSAMSRQPSLARQQSQKMLRALSVPGARAKPLPPKQEPRLTSALMSPRDCAAAEPCTPSKEPSAPAHAAGRRGSHPSSAATGVDSWVATEHAPSAESSGARKRLCMGEGVSGPSQGPADGVRHTGVTSLEVGAPGQLSSAVSIEANTGKFHSDDEARGPGSTVDAQPDPTNEAAAEQVTSEQLPESWQLKAEKPLSICADCVMPHTPEKHALVQVLGYPCSLSQAAGHSVFCRVFFKAADHLTSCRIVAACLHTSKRNAMLLSVLFKMLLIIPSHFYA